MTVTILQGPHAQARLWEKIRQERGPGFKPGKLVSASMKEATYEVIPENQEDE